MPKWDGFSPDIVVIGGGLVGSCVTYYLAKEGVRVLLLEREGITSGTSGCCFGHLPLFSEPETVHRLTRASLALWKEMAKEFGDEFEYRVVGTLWIAGCEEDLPLIEEKAEQMASYGHQGFVFDRSGTLAREPNLTPRVAGSFLYPNDVVIQPMLAARAMLAAAMRLGAKVRPWTQVENIELGSQGQVEAVTTLQGRVKTSALVNACGVWAPAVCNLVGINGVPIFPRKGEVLVTEVDRELIRHDLVDIGYLRLAHGQEVHDPMSGEPDPGGGAFTIQPQPPGNYLIGSSRQFAGFSRTVNRGLLAQMAHQAIRFNPKISRVRILRCWAGLRPFTPDHLPIIGEVIGRPGFYMAAGHEGLGVVCAPITGKLISQQFMAQDPTIEVSEFALRRFDEVQIR